MKLNLLPVLCLLSLFSCGEASMDSKPKDLLSKQDMALILMDAHLGEAGVMSAQMGTDSNYAYYMKYMDDVFKKHGISPEVFRSSYDYYALNPKTMDEIYGIVVDSLAAIESREGFAMTPEERATKDSIEVMKLHYQQARMDSLAKAKEATLKK